MNIVNRVKQSGVVKGSGTYIQLYGGTAAPQHQTFMDGFYGWSASKWKRHQIPLMIEVGSEWLLTTGMLEHVSSTDVRLYPNLTITSANGNLSSSGWGIGPDDGEVTVSCVNSAAMFRSISVRDGDYVENDALGDTFETGPKGSVAIGPGALAQSEDSISIGTGAYCYNGYKHSIQIGTGASTNSKGQYSIAIGHECFNGAHASFVTGRGNYAGNPYSFSHGIGDLNFNVGAAPKNIYQNQERFIKLCTTSGATPEVLSARDIDDNSIIVSDSDYVYCDSGVTVCQAYITAYDPATSTTKVFKLEFAVKVDADYTAANFVGTVAKSVFAADAGASSWDVAVTSPTVSDGFQIEVTGESGKDIVWHGFITTFTVAVY